MHPNPELRRWLALPASVGASHIVLAQLDHVLKSFRELDRSEPETLHEFRVGVRRLRSLVKAYGEILKESATDDVRRELKKIARATNASRDADVHAAWIAGTRENLRVAERRGADWLRSQIKRERFGDDAELDETLSPKAHHILQRFRKRLREEADSYHHRTKGKRPKGDKRKKTSHRDPEHTLAAETAIRVQQLADTLVRALRAITSPSDDRLLHRARIAAKHLRYVLEPLADSTVFPPLPSFVDRLRSLQDVLGDLHDATIFANQVANHVRRAGHEGARQVAAAIRTHVSSDSATYHRAVAEAQLRNPLPGLLALAERLQSRHETGYLRTHDEWLANFASVAVMPAYELAGVLEALALDEGSLLSER